MDDLIKTMKISGAGMKAQGTRLRVIAENVANASSLPTTPGDTPYRRQVITFKNELDRRMGLDMVQVDKVGPDRSEFGPILRTRATRGRTKTAMYGPPT